jgi:hypothetical protein
LRRRRESSTGPGERGDRQTVESRHGRELAERLRALLPDVEHLRQRRLQLLRGLPEVVGIFEDRQVVGVAGHPVDTEDFRRLLPADQADDLVLVPEVERRVDEFRPLPGHETVRVLRGVEHAAEAEVPDDVVESGTGD